MLWIIERRMLPIRYTQLRTMSLFRVLKKTLEKTPEQWQEIDKVSKDDKLVYHGDNGLNVKFSYALTFLGTLSYVQEAIVCIKEGSNVIPHIPSLAIIFVMFLSIHQFQSKCVVRIYYNQTKDEFLAIKYNNSLFSHKRIVFKPNVAVRPVFATSWCNPLLTWRKKQYLVNDEFLYLPYNFVSEIYYDKFYRDETDVNS